VTLFITDSSKQELTLTSPRTEHELPNLVKDLTDREEPNRKALATEAIEPSLMKDLTEREDAICTPPMTERLAASRQ
jgi:hypothetical protein